MFAAYWAILRFYPQGDVPRGTFTNTYNAIDHIYSTWHIWSAIRVDVGFLAIDWRGGVLSIIPAAATMLLGTLIGDLLRREDLEPRRKVVGLVKWGAVMCVVGFLWAFDLPFNKPRWTPCYLIWCSGVGTLILAMLYDLIDVRNVRRGTYPLVVFGTNAIALYWCSIMFKVLVLNTPRPHGKPLIEVILGGLKGTLGPWAGGWTFTIAFIGFWWVIMDQLYRRKIFLKL
jgi:predicted acyltransferase